MKNHPMMHFYSQYYTHERKLRLLIQLEDQLIKADKGRRENRKGTQEICRMANSTQSYYMFDSKHYKVARKLYYSLDRKDQYANEDDDFIKNNKRLMEQLGA